MNATAIPVVLAFLERRPSIGDAFMFLIMGMSVVLAVLAFMWIGTSIMGAIFSGLDRKETAKAAAAKEAAAEEQRRMVAAAAAIAATTQPAPANGGEENRLVAVIAAAAHVVLGAQARIINIRPVQSDWSAEGRRQIFASHRVR